MYASFPKFTSPTNLTGFFVRVNKIVLFMYPKIISRNKRIILLVNGID